MAENRFLNHIVGRHIWGTAHKLWLRWPARRKVWGGLLHFVVLFCAIRLHSHSNSKQNYSNWYWLIVIIKLFIYYLLVYLLSLPNSQFYIITCVYVYIPIIASRCRTCAVKPWAFWGAPVVESIVQFFCPPLWTVARQRHGLRGATTKCHAVAEEFCGSLSTVVTSQRMWISQSTDQIAVGIQEGLLLGFCERHCRVGRGSNHFHPFSRFYYSPNQPIPSATLQISEFMANARRGLMECNWHQSQWYWLRLNAPR